MISNKWVIFASFYFCNLFIRKFLVLNSFTKFWICELWRLHNEIWRKNSLFNKNECIEAYDEKLVGNDFIHTSSSKHFHIDKNKKSALHIVKIHTNIEVINHICVLDE